MTREKRRTFHSWLKWDKQEEIVNIDRNGIVADKFPRHFLKIPTRNNVLTRILLGDQGGSVCRHSLARAPSVNLQSKFCPFRRAQ